MCSSPRGTIEWAATMSPNGHFRAAATVWKRSNHLGSDITAWRTQELSTFPKYSILCRGGGGCSSSSWSWNPNLDGMWCVKRFPVPCPGHDTEVIQRITQYQLPIHLLWQCEDVISLLVKMSHRADSCEEISMKIWTARPHKSSRVAHGMLIVKGPRVVSTVNALQQHDQQQEKASTSHCCSVCSERVMGDGRLFSDKAWFVCFKGSECCPFSCLLFEDSLVSLLVSYPLRQCFEFWLHRINKAFCPLSSQAGRDTLIIIIIE